MDALLTPLGFWHPALCHLVPWLNLLHHQNRPCSTLPNGFRTELSLVALKMHKSMHYCHNKKLKKKLSCLGGKGRRKKGKERRKVMGRGRGKEELRDAFFNKARVSITIFQRLWIELLAWNFLLGTSRMAFWFDYGVCIAFQMFQDYYTTLVSLQENSTASCHTCRLKWIG